MNCGDRRADERFYTSPPNATIAPARPSSSSSSDGGGARRGVAPFPSTPPLPSPPRVLRAAEHRARGALLCSALSPSLRSHHSGNAGDFGTWRGDHGHLLRVSSIFRHFKFQLRCAIKFWKALSLLRYPFHKAQKFLLTRVSRDGTRSPNWLRQNKIGLHVTPERERREGPS